MIRARVKPRRYDEKKGRYVYDVSFKAGFDTTPRTAKVAEAFGLGIDEDRSHTLLSGFEVRIAEGDVVYITGESGSGKSVLLRALLEDLGDRAADISRVEVDESKPIIESIGATFREALSLLSRVGLNDAYLFLRRYGELSEGQRYRYRIAKLIDSGKKFWVADEFCSTLDRTTATIVAYNIQKHARRSGATLIAATSHTDLAEDLHPSVTIRKGWGDRVSIAYAPNYEAPTCTATNGIAVREGTKKDYEALSSLHYRDSRLPVPLKIFAARKDGETVGVIAYSYPGVRAAGRRRAAGFSPTIEELNRDWAVVSRVVVHPLYRSTGLGARLIRETLPFVGRNHIELIAVMAEYNPFAERAGMTLIQITQPHTSITRAVDRLRDLGFNPALLQSAKHTIEAMGHTGTIAVRDILLDVDTIYLKRLISSTHPYVSRAEASRWFMDQEVERYAKCLRNLAVLNQPKAYLHWTTCNVNPSDSGSGEVAGYEE